MSDAGSAAASGAPAPASAEDAKLVALARGARARAAAAEGAAVLDDMGRSYSAASVELDALRLSAVQAAVAAAVSSGSQRLDAAVVVTSEEGVGTDDAALLDELGARRVMVVDLAGNPVALPST